MCPAVNCNSNQNLISANPSSGVCCDSCEDKDPPSTQQPGGGETPYVGTGITAQCRIYGWKGKTHYKNEVTVEECNKQCNERVEKSFRECKFGTDILRHSGRVVKSRLVYKTVIGKDGKKRKIKRRKVKVFRRDKNGKLTLYRRNKSKMVTVYDKNGKKIRVRQKNKKMRRNMQRDGKWKKIKHKNMRREKWKDGKRISFKHKRKHKIRHGSKKYKQVRVRGQNKKGNRYSQRRKEGDKSLINGRFRREKRKFNRKNNRVFNRSKRKRRSSTRGSKRRGRGNMPSLPRGYSAKRTKRTEKKRAFNENHDIHIRKKRRVSIVTAKMGT